RDKLDEYFGSVRELEQRLVKAEEWAKKPKPKVNAKQPQDIPNSGDLIGRTRLLFDLTHLALQTDSTRLVTILLGGASVVPPIAGGGFKHGRHLAFDAKGGAPLCNLYVSMLQRLGIEADKFGSSTSTLTGLETS